ncbi:uncharacterized protein TNCV_3245771 [Trichonephila clavipes]|nr:uncharacterized protein TNCV_3245771 [Trichonephila clavipes]
MQTIQDALFICYKQSSDNARSVALSQRSCSPRLIEEETFNDSDTINNLIDYEDRQKESNSLRGDKIMQGSSLPTNWKSIFLKLIPIKKGCGYERCRLDKVGILREMKSEQMDAPDPSGYDIGQQSPRTRYRPPYKGPTF